MILNVLKVNYFFKFRMVFEKTLNFLQMFFFNLYHFDQDVRGS